MRLPGILRTFAPILTLLFAGIFAAYGQTAQTVMAVPSRVVEHVDDAKIVRLTGNTHPLAQAKYDQGLVDPAKQLAKIVLVLKRSPEQEQSLAAFNERQYDPKSRDFHHWLTATEFGQLYGPSDFDIAQITSWLQNHGFSVDEVAKGRTWIHFTGTVAQVQEAFHLEMHNYLVNGETHISNDRDPSIPAALAPVITGIASLNDIFPKSPFHPGNIVTRDPKTGRSKIIDRQAGSDPGLQLPRIQDSSVGYSGDSLLLRPEYSYTDPEGYTQEDLTPYDLAIIYNVLPLWQAATPINGTGITVAVVGNTDVDMADVNNYRTVFKLPSGTINVIQTDPATDPGTGSGEDDAENEVDLEMLSASAPGAILDLVVSANTSTTQGPTLSSAYIVDNEIAPIVTSSYGECEPALQTAGNAQMNQIWQQGATEGISIFVSSGDQGSTGCDSSNTVGPSPAVVGPYVNGIASPPYVTAVGGTDLGWYYDQPTYPRSTYWNPTPDGNGATAKGYMPEIAWNTTCSNPLLLQIFTQSGGQPFANPEALCQNLDTNASLKGIVKVSATSGGQSSCTVYTSTSTSCSGGYPKPSWQVGHTDNDSVRDLPDIAMFGSYGFDLSLSSGVDIPSTTLLFCVSSFSPYATCNYSSSEIAFQENGGTSAASPYSAGVMALVLQKNGGQKQGLANPVFYKMAAAQSNTACSSDTVAAGNSCYFHDVTRGSNAMVCKSGGYLCTAVNSGDTLGLSGGTLNGTYIDLYEAGVAYDNTTGLGSMNVANVVNGWAAMAGSPTLTLSAGTLTFASTTVGSTSTAQTVTVKNTGTETATLTSETLTGTDPSSFAISANSCTSSLAAGASCSVSVEFKPTSATALTASLSIADNATGSPQTVAMSGTGTAASTFAVSLSPTTLAFASTTVGSTTAAQVVTVKNTGTGAVTLTSETLTGTGAASFLISANTCTASLAAGASCAVSVEFKPASAATFAANLSVADNATGSPQTVALSGTGTAAAGGGTLTVTPASLTFASTTVGSVTAAQQVILKNTGTTTVTFTGFTYSGANTSSFVQSGINCGTTIAAGASCAVAIEFKPAAAGALTAALNIADNATGSPQTVTLSGTGVASGSGGTLTVTPASLTFVSTTVGSVTAAQQVILKNTGTTTVTFTGFTYSGANTSSFVQSGINCGTTIAAGASCAVAIEFKPAVAGALTATLNIADNATGSPQTVALSGTGVTAGGSGTLTITPASLSLSYATTAVGSVTAAQQVILKNTGSTAITLSGFTYTGTNTSSFVQSGINCGTSLAAGAACAVAIEFKPQSAGALTATLNIADSATGSPQKVTLSGTGTGGTAATVTLSPTSLAFPNTIIGSTSDAQVVTLTNTGSTAVTISSITLGGSSPASYLDLSNCGTSLAASASCSIYVAFKPATAAALAATLSVADSATGSPQTVALTGTGTAAPSVKLSATSLTFGTVAHGTTSAAQMLTLTNSGTATLTLTSITLGGTGAADFEALDTCGATLAPAASCTVYVAFKPAAAAAYTATLSIADNGSASPQSISLTGTGN